MCIRDSFQGAQGRFTSPDPGNAGAYRGNPQSWNGYAYVRNRALVGTDPDGRMPQPRGDMWTGGGGITVDGVASVITGNLGGNALAGCPGNECMRYNYEQGNFQWFTAGAGGATGYENFSDLGHLNEWGGSFYNDDQFQSYVVGPRREGQHWALAVRIADLMGMTPDEVYPQLVAQWTKGGNTDFLPHGKQEDVYKRQGVRGQIRSIRSGSSSRR